MEGERHLIEPSMKIFKYSAKEYRNRSDWWMACTKLEKAVGRDIKMEKKKATLIVIVLWVVLAYLSIYFLDVFAGTDVMWD